MNGEPVNNKMMITENGSAFFVKANPAECSSRPVSWRRIVHVILELVMGFKFKVHEPINGIHYLFFCTVICPHNIHCY